MIILSLILIWFGANQWRAPLLPSRRGVAVPPELEESPLETGLRAAMNGGSRVGRRVPLARTGPRRAWRPRHS